MQSTHDNDFYGWALETPECLRTGRLNEIDFASVAEEIEDMGKTGFTEDAFPDTCSFETEKLLDPGYWAE